MASASRDDAPPDVPASDARGPPRELVRGDQRHARLGHQRRGAGVRREALPDGDAHLAPGRGPVVGVQRGDPLRGPAAVPARDAPLRGRARDRRGRGDDRARRRRHGVGAPAARDAALVAGVPAVRRRPLQRQSAGPADPAAGRGPRPDRRAGQDLRGPRPAAARRVEGGGRGRDRPAGDRSRSCRGAPISPSSRRSAPPSASSPTAA